MHSAKGSTIGWGHGTGVLWALWFSNTPTVRGKPLHSLHTPRHQRSPPALLFPAWLGHAVSSFGSICPRNREEGKENNRAEPAPLAREPHKPHGENREENNRNKTTGQRN